MKGIGASQGIAIGKVFLLEKVEVIPNDTKIDMDSVEDELNRLEKAKEKTKDQLSKLYDDTIAKVGEKEASIFDAHLMLIDDPILEHKFKGYVSNNFYVAETAVRLAMNEVSHMFEELDDEYLRERAGDVIDVCTRLIYNLAEVEIVNLQDLSEEVIVVSKNLTPSDTVSMNFNKVLGFATDMGGKTSHVAIIARSLEIPAVVGMKNIFSKVENDDILIIDGCDGTVIINPTEEEITIYRSKQKELKEEKNELQKLADKEAITIDGRRVKIAANVGIEKDVYNALKNGAEAIGLYRTEFQYMDRVSLPTESELFEAYKNVAVKMGDKQVIVRTFDIGGDKHINYLNCPQEMNPFLGYRAIRLCLDRKDIFKTQLKAILRASNYGNLMIMYPMITHIEQVRQANEILNQAKLELHNQKIKFNRNIEVGIMIETPAAATIADLLIKEVDFFSIGTNDLTQYTIAVDRGNQKIEYLYNSYHPAVLRLIKKVIDESHKAGKWTGMCGEFAGDEKAAVLLLGLGLDEFSMSPTSMTKVKRIIRKCNYSSSKKIAEDLLNISSVDEVENYLDNYINNNNLKEG
ncbi:phosphoenolpyruvate-protein phosphotransferase [Vallitalea longa]|uniref:Phosphoenolpyruvate-protein phosphotransferase n=1 Tax=Vallitalea longa TaxID=2936439 RepID=A0A9W5YB45_9FIRM|nr:phosphoenolpyruvate--protein phosphotransferase [Vallitalea longa]GKX29864.1 phosphoenolpyruvate-protein phosphotransferase [Vallitalea longa]